jgi:hypothetical protein
MIDLDEIKRTLERIVGQEFLFTSEKPEYYAYLFGDATMYRSKPEYVVYPGSVEEIQAIIKFASNRKLKVIPGAGLTGLSGGAVCDGGILLNPSRLRSIKNVDAISRTVIVEPGISCAQLNYDSACSSSLSRNIHSWCEYRFSFRRYMGYVQRYFQKLFAKFKSSRWNGRSY